MEKTDTEKQTKWSRSGRGLTAEAEVHDDEVRIELHGEVDLYTQPVLRSALAPALELEVPSLVVDLRDVTHLDSGGMAILISAAKKLKARNGKLSLVAVNSHIYRTLTITGLADFLNASPAETEKAA